MARFLCYLSLLSSLVLPAEVFAASYYSVNTPLQVNSTLLNDTQLAQLSNNTIISDVEGGVWASSPALFNNSVGWLTPTIALSPTSACAFAQFFVLNYTLPPDNHTYPRGAFALQVISLRSARPLKYVIAHVGGGSGCFDPNGVSNKIIVFNDTEYANGSMSTPGATNFYDNGTMEYIFPYTELVNGSTCFALTYGDFNDTQCDSTLLYESGAFVLPISIPEPTNTTGVWRRYHGLFNNSIGFITPNISANDTNPCTFAQFFITNYTLLPAIGDNTSDFSIAYPQGAFVLQAQLINSTSNLSYVIAHVGGGEGCFHSDGVSNKEIIIANNNNNNSSVGVGAMNSPGSLELSNNGTLRFVFSLTELSNGTTCFALTYSNLAGVQCDTLDLFKNGHFDYNYEPTGIVGGPSVAPTPTSSVPTSPASPSSSSQTGQSYHDGYRLYRKFIERNSKGH